MRGRDVRVHREHPLDHVRHLAGLLSDGSPPAGSCVSLSGADG